MVIDFTRLAGVLAVCAVWAVHPAYAQTSTRELNAPATAAATIRASFACDAGKAVAAVFGNGAQNSVALVLSDGHRLSLQQTMSGSGARYANVDDSFVFWNKGNVAFIDENGKPAYSGCTTQR